MTNISSTSKARVSQSKPLLRVIAIVAAVVFAIVAPTVQTLAPFGLSAAEFARDGNETLRAAGYAFSIWGLIYFGLAIYAVYQALPQNRETRLLKLVGWPSVFSIAGCGAWIMAAAFDQKIATIVIIAASAANLTLAAIRGALIDMSRGERWFVLIPLALLAGWLTIATALNTITVLTALDLITPERADAAAITGIALLTLVGLGVVRRARLAAYGLPIAWGLAALVVTGRPNIAIGATVAALIVGGYALWIGTRPKRNIDVKDA